MGMVYRAEDVKLQRTVALKFLPPALTSDPAAKERFVTEARAASALDHPNICTIHEIGETDEGTLFIVMSCYEGETLDRRIAREQLSFDDAVRIMVQICQGLEKAHAAGMVHRDIKPSNIMVTADGQVKILDFGLAKFMRGEVTTRSGVVAGTSTYMSPEQIRGDTLDERTDIWSLGVTFYEMLTGRLPFSGTYPDAVYYSILHTQPEPVTRFRSDVPPALAAIVIDCLQKAKTARPRSVGDVRQRIQDRGTSPGTVSTVGKSLFRYLWRGGIVVLCLAAGIWAFVQYLLPSLSTVPRPPIIIAVLEFQNNTGDESVKEWPVFIQMLMSQRCTGQEQIMVIDPPSLNHFTRHTAQHAGMGMRISSDVYEAIHTTLSVTHIIDGTIERGASSYLISARVVDPVTQRMTHGVIVPVRDDDQLQSAVDSLVVSVMEYLQIKLLSSSEDRNIAPFMGTRKLQAMQAFLQAYEYNLRMSPEVERYLQLAIDLDSAFISPRVWLIPRIVYRGNLDLARFHYQEVARRHPHPTIFERIMLDFADACIRGDLQAQINHLQVALKYTPGNCIAYYNLAWLRFQSKDWQGSLDAALPAVAMHWPYPPLYMLAGDAYYRLEKYRESREVLEEGLTFDPVVPDLYLQLSSVYYRTNDTAAARRQEQLYLGKRKVLGAGNAEAFRDMGDWNRVAGLPRIAIGHYRAASAQDPSNAEFHRLSGAVALDMRDTASAITSFEKVLTLDGLDSTSLLSLGDIAFNRQVRGEAARMYRTFLSRFLVPSPERERVERRIQEFEH